MKEARCSSGSSFEEEYFERHASYGKAGGYQSMLASARGYYAEYFRIAAQSVPEIYDGMGRRAIEVGCAFGAGSAMLYDRGWKVDATDVSAYACERARALLPPGVSVRRMDIVQQVAEGGMPTYDLVVAIQVVEHVAGMQFVEALGKLVAPGGSLIVATPNPRSISPYRRFQEDPTHINEQPPDHWCTAIRNLGLEIKQVGVYHALPVVSRFKIRYVRAPSRLGYDTILIAKRPE